MRGYTEGTRAHLALQRRAAVRYRRGGRRRREEKEKSGEVGKNGRGNSCTDSSREEASARTVGVIMQKAICGNYYDTGVNDTPIFFPPWDAPSSIVLPTSRLFLSGSIERYYNFTLRLSSFHFLNREISWN